MSRTRVKICGITNERDAVEAVNCGADALGFVFHAGSSRYVSPVRAAEIAQGLPGFVTTVALCVDETLDSLNAILELFPANLIQFHGAETPDFCDSSGVPYIRALPATTREEVAMRSASYRNAQSILLDTWHKGQFGGTGKVFDWTLVPEIQKPLIIAGGLDAENVQEAIIQLRPYAVDVSGGVEASKGNKDTNKMKAFIAAVQAADRELG
jgi:phosphoribosylanthranilate isomerase